MKDEIHTSLKHLFQPILDTSSKSSHSQYNLQDSIIRKTIQTVISRQEESRIKAATANLYDEQTKNIQAKSNNIIGDGRKQIFQPPVQVLVQARSSKLGTSNQRAITQISSNVEKRADPFNQQKLMNKSPNNANVVITLGSGQKSKSSRVMKQGTNEPMHKQFYEINSLSVANVHSSRQSGFELLSSAQVSLFQHQQQLPIKPRQKMIDHDAINTTSKKRFSDIQKRYEQKPIQLIFKKSSSQKSFIEEQQTTQKNNAESTSSQNIMFAEQIQHIIESNKGANIYQLQKSQMRQGNNIQANRSASVSNIGHVPMSSHKKSLMPSGSSSTLFRKQILELDEANSSSSSSIGKEENANQALNGSTTNGTHKMKILNEFGNLSSLDSSSKNVLNMSSGGNHQSDSIFNTNGIDQNIGELEESMIDRYRIEIPTSKLKDVKISGKFIKEDEIEGGTSKRKFDESNADDTLLLDNKILISASQAFALINANEQTLKGLKTLKNNQPIASPPGGISQPLSKSQLSQRQGLQPSSLPSSIQQLQRLNNSPSMVKIRQHQGAPAPIIQLKQTTIIPQKTGNKERFDEESKQQAKMIKIKVQRHNIQQTSGGVSPLLLNSDMIYRRKQPEDNIPLKDGSFLERPQVSPRVSQKRGEDPSEELINLANDNSSKREVKKLESRTIERKMQKLVNGIQKPQISQLPNFSIKEHHIMPSKSKSPSEMVIDSARIMMQPNLGSNQFHPAKKMQTQDLLGISQFAIISPKKQVHIQRNFQQSKAVSRQLNVQVQKNLSTHEAKERQVKVIGIQANEETQQMSFMKSKQQFKESNYFSNDRSPSQKPEDLEERISSPKSIHNQLNATLKSQTSQQISIIKGLNDAKGRLDKLLDEFNNFSIEDDVNEERELPDESNNRPMITNFRNQVVVSSKQYHQSKLYQGQSASENLREEHTPNKKHHQSPSISNRIPNSLAFRIHNHEDQISSEKKQDRMIAGDYTHVANVFEEDTYLMSTRRIGVNGEFSLRNKNELNRNIPFSKFGMDFSGIPHSDKSPNKKLRSIVVRCSQILTSPDSLCHVVGFLDFVNLLKIMSLNKTFREGFASRPSTYQKKLGKIFKQQLRSILINSLSSTTQRIMYWNFRTKFFYGKKKKPNLYRTLKRLKTNEIAAAEIRKDIHRTFPDIDYFQSQGGQIKLFNVLNAIAQKNVKTGYIQGMNFLAGTILLNLQKGEETFWMMMSILNKFGFDSILDLKKGGRFQVLCFQLEIMMQNFLPELSSHLKQLKIPTDIYAANWFITMFSSELSLDLVFCILDMFLLDGIKSLLRVSLALLKFMEKRLLSMDFDECMVYLSHCQKDLEIDSQTLLQTAYSFSITKSMLSELESYFNLITHRHASGSSLRIALCLKSFHRLSLQLSAKNNGSYFWLILPATSEDMQEIIKQSLNHVRHNDLAEPLTEEEILIFYSENLQHKPLSKILITLSKQIETYHNEMTQSPQQMIKTQRKKALSTVVHDEAQIAVAKGQHQIGITTTIHELSNDEYSRGGYSSSKKSAKIMFKPIAEDEFDIRSSSKDTHLIDYRSIQVHKSVLGIIDSNEHPMISQEEVVDDQYQIRDKLLIQSSESPFSGLKNRIGTSIKNIFGNFGNFFKIEEKHNKSYEERDDTHPDDVTAHVKISRDSGGAVLMEGRRGAPRSKSIYGTSAVSQDQIMIADNTIMHSKQHDSFNAGETIMVVNKPMTNKRADLGVNFRPSSQISQQQFQQIQIQQGNNTKQMRASLKKSLKPSDLPRGKHINRAQKDLPQIMHINESIKNNLMVFTNQSNGILGQQSRTPDPYSRQEEQAYLNQDLIQEEEYYRINDFDDDSTRGADFQFQIIDHHNKVNK